MLVLIRLELLVDNKQSVLIDMLVITEVRPQRKYISKKGNIKEKHQQINPFSD